MLYVIVGTENSKREKARVRLAKLGQPLANLYSEHAGMLRSYIDAQDMFGDAGVYYCLSFGDVPSSKEILYSLLEEMKVSKNHFVVDEPFADVHVATKLKKFADEFFDAKEEKVKDVSVFTLCDAFVARDKKVAWELFTNMKNNSEAEAIAGALWWKFQTVWSKVLEGKKTSFTKEECEIFGKRIIEAPIRAHNGELDLKMELERIILSL